MNSSFKPALACSKHAAAVLAARMQKHRELLNIVRAALPMRLSERVAHCVLSGRKLLLYTGSAAWASQLRFHADAILAAVNAVAGESVETIATRILPPVEERHAPRRRPKLPSAQSIEALRGGVNDIADDSLRQALTRLGATLKRLYEAEDPD